MFDLPMGLGVVFTLITRKRESMGGWRPEGKRGAQPGKTRYAYKRKPKLIGWVKTVK